MPYIQSDTRILAISRNIGTLYTIYTMVSGMLSRWHIANPLDATPEMGHGL
ncbi:hypothetical protein V2H45_08165 [Tumidithrix elongata RA019]|uniref:Uncharacterized protein n=1 Tax=Tumidithrix elongata BACA0141 TaxID=2716417 RepID=A0AAW9PV82_9CYAN|nr:hypothetical protein [Tumidithrix elongata RA019]